MSDLGDNVVTRARALKDQCYAAWHSAPAEASICAAELADLTRISPNTAAGAQVEAFWQWTEGIASIAAGHLPEAIEHLDRARERFRSLGMTIDAAQTQVPRIMALSLLGRCGEAERCALATRDEFLAQHDIGSAAKVVLNLGSLCYSQDRYAEAAEYYSLSSAWFARIGDREHSVLADVARGDACSFLGNLDEAEALYRRAAHRAHVHGLSVIHASTTQALAELELVRGRYREALSGLESASRSFAALNLPMLRNQAERSLAETYLELNLLREADALFSDIILSVNEDSAAAAWVNIQRARLALKRNDLRSAESTLLAAHRHFLEMKNEVGVAEADLTTSAIHMAKRDWSTALAHAHSAQTTLAGLQLPRAHADLAVAAAEVRMGEYAAAEQRLATLAHAPEVTLPIREGACLWLGRSHLARGDLIEAKRAFGLAVELSEAGVLRMPADDLRCGYLDARAGAYEELLGIALLEFEAGPGHGTAQAVLEVLERLRARSLQLRLNSPARMATVLEGVWPSASKDDRERLDWLYRRTSRHLGAAETADEPVSLSLIDERQNLEQRLLEQVRRHRVAEAGGRRAATPTPCRTAAHAAHPDTGASLVSYGLLNDEVFAVTKHDGVCRVHRRLTDTSTLDGALRSLQNQLLTQRLGERILRKHQALLLKRVRGSLGTLYDLLWRPIKQAMPSATNVRIVPAGAVSTVPFAALWDGQCYLVERTAVSFLLRATGIPPPIDFPPPGRVTVMADTNRLSGSLMELNGLASIWPSARTLSGADFTRSNLVECAQQCDLLHIASHSEFRPDNPLFSALHLADDSLLALEIEDLPLRPGATVVLSGCESALSEGGRRDEALGLVRAFLVAGAASVIAGLWQLDDTATAHWMIALHRQLRDYTTEPQRYRSALATLIGSVQKQYIHAGIHPYHWAAFTVHNRA